MTPDNPLGRAMLESAQAMVDAMYDNEAVVDALVKLAVNSASARSGATPPIEEAQQAARNCMAILIAIGQGKIPHVKWEPKAAGSGGRG